MAPLVWALMLGACARNSRQVAWDRAFAQVAAAPPADAGRLYLDLVPTAPRAVDAGAAQFAAAAALAGQGDVLAAARVYQSLARTGDRRADRARAYYQLGRMAESRGDLVRAVGIYRGLVLTYPDEIPGERAFAQLERIIRAEGADSWRRMEAHLAWTHAHYAPIAHTPLGDNFIYQAARDAEARYIHSHEEKWGLLAESLYRRVRDEHLGKGLWNDAVWRLSLLYHRMGRYADELHAIKRLQTTREKISLFGHDEHRYFWVGQLRIAALHLDAGRPAEAARAYGWFIGIYRDSIWLDDVLFWQGCAWLLAGDAAAAEDSFAAIAEVREDSKYLRRLDSARRDPAGDHCRPRDFVAGER